MRSEGQSKRFYGVKTRNKYIGIDEQRKDTGKERERMGKQREIEGRVGEGRILKYKRKEGEGRTKGKEGKEGGGEGKKYCKHN